MQNQLNALKKAAQANRHKTKSHMGYYATNQNGVISTGPQNFSSNTGNQMSSTNQGKQQKLDDALYKSQADLSLKNQKDPSTTNLKSAPRHPSGSVTSPPATGLHNNGANSNEVVRSQVFTSSGGQLQAQNNNSNQQTQGQQVRGVSANKQRRANGVSNSVSAFSGTYNGNSQQHDDKVGNSQSQLMHPNYRYMPTDMSNEQNQSSQVTGANTTGSVQMGISRSKSTRERGYTPTPNRIGVAVNVSSNQIISPNVAVSQQIGTGQTKKILSTGVSNANINHIKQTTGALDVSQLQNQQALSSSQNFQGNLQAYTAQQQVRLPKGYFAKDFNYAQRTASNPRPTRKAPSHEATRQSANNTATGFNVESQNAQNQKGSNQLDKRTEVAKRQRPPSTSQTKAYEQYLNQQNHLIQAQNQANQLSAMHVQKQQTAPNPQGQSASKVPKLPLVPESPGATKQPNRSSSNYSTTQQATKKVENSPSRSQSQHNQQNNQSMGSKYGSITQGGAMSISGGPAGFQNAAQSNLPGQNGSQMIQSMSIARVDSIATHIPGDKSTKTGSQQQARFHHYEAAAGLEDIHSIFVFQFRQAHLITAKLESNEGSEAGMLVSGSTKKAPVFKPQGNILVPDEEFDL